MPDAKHSQGFVVGVTRRTHRALFARRAKLFISARSGLFRAYFGIRTSRCRESLPSTSPSDSHGIRQRPSTTSWRWSLAMYKAGPMRRALSLSTSLRTRPARPPQLHYRMASTLPNLPIFQAIANHDPDSTAVIHSGSKRSFSYHNLLQDVVAAKGQILSSAKASTLLGERVAFFAENSYEYVGMRQYRQLKSPGFSS